MSDLTVTTDLLLARRDRINEIAALGALTVNDPMSRTVPYLKSLAYRSARVVMIEDSKTIIGAMTYAPALSIIDTVKNIRTVKKLRETGAADAWLTTCIYTDPDLSAKNLTKRLFVEHARDLVASGHTLGLNYGAATERLHRWVSYLPGHTIIPDVFDEAGRSVGTLDLEILAQAPVRRDVA